MLSTQERKQQILSFSSAEINLEAFSLFYITLYKELYILDQALKDDTTHYCVLLTQWFLSVTRFDNSYRECAIFQSTQVCIPAWCRYQDGLKTSKYISISCIKLRVTNAVPKLLTNKNFRN